MQFITINVYDNYVSAHIAKGRLEEDNINCWLKDENTVTIDPILTNAVGGIKLMVPDVQAERAVAILRELESKHKALNACPKCGSHNIESVSTPKKAANWLSVLIGFFITSYAIPVETVIHCFNCGNEYKADDKTQE